MHNLFKLLLLYECHLRNKSKQKIQIQMEINSKNLSIE